MMILEEDNVQVYIHVCMYVCGTSVVVTHNIYDGKETTPHLKKPLKKLRHT